MNKKIAVAGKAVDVYNGREQSKFSKKLAGQNIKESKRG